MSVDVVSFYLPLDSGTRIAFKISILLGYTVFRVNLTDELPATAISTPLIGGTFMFTLTLSVFKVLGLFLPFPFKNRNSDFHLNPRRR